MTTMADVMTLDPVAIRPRETPRQISTPAASDRAVA